MEEYNIKFVANYIRKSRAENEQDLEKQRIILIDLCNKNKFKYVEYVEVGSSDSIDMRPQISKLLKEVEVGLYDAVCITEYDRLGRGDLGEQDRIKKAFQKSNTLIITPEKIYDLNDDMDETFTEYSNAIVHLFQCFEALVPEKQCMLPGTSAVATFNLQVEALCHRKARHLPAVVFCHEDIDFHLSLLRRPRLLHLLFLQEPCIPLE